jgi:penicillin-binding protein 2
MWGEYDLNNLGFDVAIKTGTPQSPRGTDTFVIGFAPAYNPEIAFCAMVEGGKNAKFMVRGILDAYAQNYPNSRIGVALGGRRKAAAAE